VIIGYVDGFGLRHGRQKRSDCDTVPIKKPTAQIFRASVGAGRGGAVRSHVGKRPAPGPGHWSSKSKRHQKPTPWSMPEALTRGLQDTLFFAYEILHFCSAKLN
jgi:hypothetical protein